MKGLSVNIIGLVLLSIAMTACSVDREVTKAPSSQEELGFIVIGASSSKVKESGLSYRIINEKHELVEVYSSEEKIRAAFPEASIEKNQMDNKYDLSGILDERVSEEEMLENFINGCGKKENISVLIKNKNKEPVLDPLSQVTIGEMGESINLEVVQLDGEVSSETKFYWILANVGFARYDKYLYEGKNLSLELKGVGQYEFTVIAKDQNNTCGISSYSHWVTSNTPIEESIVEVPSSVPNMKHIELAGVLNGKTDRLNKTLVAVIDTGVNYNHAELNGSIYRNKKEIPGNGLDDDENGFADDYSGYDFFNKDDSPMDDMGHGSHVSGLVAGVNSGVTSNALILPIKVGSGSGIDSASLAGAILYAVDQEAQVINLSLGGYMRPTDAELMAYEYAKEKNVIVVISSGNGDPFFGIGIDLDSRPIYPASLDYENMIVVSASSETATSLTTYSNYGSVVDIVAPGGDSDNSLYSAAVVNGVGVYYTPMSGTSMAAPVVAGAVAEILSINSDLTYQQVKKILIESGSLDEKLEGRIQSSKHLNIDKAIELAEAM